MKNLFSRKKNVYNRHQSMRTGRGEPIMKDRYIAQLKTGEECISFFMAKSIAVKTGSNRKHYMDLTLGDKTGEISAKKWDVSDEEIAGATTQIGRASCRERV